MKYIIVDLEATCWEKGSNLERMEIIKIGAVKLDENFDVIDEFDSFIRPVREPVLSEFCTELTSIKQKDVNNAEVFAEVFPMFLDWISKENFFICSWGAYDLKHIKVEFDRNNIPFPKTFENHINIKKEVVCT